MRGQSYYLYPLVTVDYRTSSMRGKSDQNGWIPWILERLKYRTLKPTFVFLTLIDTYLILNLMWLKIKNIIQKCIILF